jgi:GST-like protein
MIDLYYWTTPNGHKITIFLEETGLEHKVIPDQHQRRRAVRAGVSRDLSQQSDSGDRRPRAGRRRRAAFVDGVGCDPAVPRREDEPLPACRFARAAGNVCNGSTGRWEGSAPWQGRTITSMAIRSRRFPYAIDRYVRETGRLYAVLNKRLADRAFVAGEYSIADMACYPWVQPERQKQNIADFPHLARWLKEIAARPAVQRAYALAKTVNVKPAADDEKSRAILFGQSKDSVR